MNAIEKKLYLRPPGWWHVVISKNGQQQLNIRCICGRMLRALPGALARHCIAYQAPATLDGLPTRTSTPITTRITKRVTAHEKFLAEHAFDLTEKKWRQRMQELEDEIARQATLQAGA